MRPDMEEHVLLDARDLLVCLVIANNQVIANMKEPAFDPESRVAALVLDNKLLAQSPGALSNMIFHRPHLAIRSRLRNKDFSMRPPGPVPSSTKSTPE